MHRILLGPWDFTLNPFWIVAVVGGLIFLSMALSFAQNKGKTGGAAIGLALGFVLIGDAILYLAYTAMKLPTSRQFDNVAINSYGVLLMVAFVVSTVFLLGRGKRPEWNVTSDTVLDLMTFIIIGSIVGARLLYVGLEWNTLYAPDVTAYESSQEALRAALLNVANITQGGLSFHGGILGALVAGFFYTAARRLNYWRMVDFVTPAIPLGGMFGRIGCFLNACCNGIETGPPLGVALTELGDGITRHPVQIYESIGHLILFTYLVTTERSAKFAGHTFLRFVVGYSWVRFATDSFRAGESARSMTLIPNTEYSVTVAQAASLLVILVGSILIKVLSMRAKAALPPTDGMLEPKSAPSAEASATA